MSEAQPKKFGIQCAFEGSIKVWSFQYVLDGSAKQRMLFTAFSDKNMLLTVFPKLSRAKYCIYNVFSVCEGSADQNIVFTVYWKVQPSKVYYLWCF